MRTTADKQVVVGADFAGFPLKEYVKAHLEKNGWTVTDLTPDKETSGMYHRVGFLVGSKLAEGEFEKALAFCGTGMGMCITVNKFRGVRGVSCHDDVTAEMSRRHNNANVMCLSADMLGDKLLNRIVEIWMKTDFEGGRHQRRLDKISEIEAANGCGSTLDTVEKTSCSGE